MQLDLLLRSIYTNAQYIDQLGVLYTYSDDKFKEGYEILKKEYPEVDFILEDNFGDQVTEFVSKSHKYYTGLVDESIFFRPIEMTEDRLDWVFNDKKALSFSLRIGKNTIWQNHWYGERMPEIDILDSYKNIFVWDANHYTANGDLGRNLHCDGTLLDRDFYHNLLVTETAWRKNKVRTLDGIGNSGRNDTESLMAAYDHSCFVNIAVTLVHELDNGIVYADNWGKFFSYDLTDLNNKFLEGKRISLSDIPVDNVNCGRMETEYVFMHE